MTSVGSVTIAKVIKIGNSQGIVIPEPLIKQCSLYGEVELGVKDGCLTVRSVSRLREGWGEDCKAMVANGDDWLLDGVVATEWDDARWEW